MNLNWPPLLACCALAVPAAVIAVVLHDRPAPQLETLDPPVYAVHQVATATVPATTAPVVVSLPPVPVVVANQTADRGIMLQVTDTVPAPPKPYVWEGPRPAGAQWGIACSVEQATVVAQVMTSRGAGYDSIVYMLGVIGRESGCRHWVRNNNPSTGDDSFSLCQLNARAGHFGPDGVLAGWDRWRMLDDFTYAADGCAVMWSVCGRGPWNAGNYYCETPEELR